MRKILSFIILFVLTIAAFADSANRKPFTVKQSDGTMLSVALVGDEALHYFVTLDGKYLVAVTVGNIPLSAGTVTYKVTPYVVKDSVRYTGDSYTVSFIGTDATPAQALR